MTRNTSNEGATNAARSGDDVPVALRPVTPEDAPFLQRLYASTREDEVAGWGWDEAQREAFFSIQFRAQQMSYEADYPLADHSIILRGGQPVGRLIVERTEREIRGVDIALLPEWRGGGTGTALIQGLLAEADAAGRPFRIHVSKNNRAAMRLYERLGLRVVGEDAFNFQMEWSPTGARDADAREA